MDYKSLGKAAALSALLAMQNKQVVASLLEKDVEPVNVDSLLNDKLQSDIKN